MTWPVVSGSATSKSSSGTPPPNGSSGPTLPRTWLPDRHVGEVDDHVGALGQAHEEPVPVVGGEVHRRGEEAALVADRHTSTPGIWLKSRIRKRDWQPLRTRNR